MRLRNWTYPLFLLHQRTGSIASVRHIERSNEVLGKNAVATVNAFHSRRGETGIEPSAMELFPHGFVALRKPLAQLEFLDLHRSFDLPQLF